MQKNERHKAILEIISAASVSRQDVLANELIKRGFAVTQASVSRDLDELGVVKADGFYKRPLPSVGGSPYGKVSLTLSGTTMIVARCASGLASAAAVMIDAAEIPDIAGTIAGDDTIFIAVTDARRQSAVTEALTKLFGV